MSFICVMTVTVEDVEPSSTGRIIVPDRMVSALNNEEKYFKVSFKGSTFIKKLWCCFSARV